MRAYVFINAQGDWRSIAEKVRAIKGVKQADALWGPVDVVAVVEVEAASALMDLVARQIRAIPGIVSTDTRIAV